LFNPHLLSLFVILFKIIVKIYLTNIENMNLPKSFSAIISLKYLGVYKMSDNEILVEVKKVLMEDFEVEEAVITPAASFYDDLGMDSLDAIDLIVTMNNVFDIDVDNKAIENTKTIQELIDVVKSNLA
jgi:acyl carrier protein